MSPAARVNRILLFVVTAVVVVTMTLGSILRRSLPSPIDGKKGAYR